ncbi:hypothetical protein M153_13670002761, partial [Pseudoloma neurophilia]
MFQKLRQLFSNTFFSNDHSSVQNDHSNLQNDHSNLQNDHSSLQNRKTPLQTQNSVTEKNLIVSFKKTRLHRPSDISSKKPIKNIKQLPGIKKIDISKYGKPFDIKSLRKSNILNTFQNRLEYQRFISLEYNILFNCLSNVFEKQMPFKIFQMNRIKNICKKNHFKILRSKREYDCLDCLEFDILRDLRQNYLIRFGNLFFEIQKFLKPDTYMNKLRNKLVNDLAMDIRNMILETAEIYGIGIEQLAGRSFDLPSDNDSRTYSIVKYSTFNTDIKPRVLVSDPSEELKPLIEEYRQNGYEIIDQSYFKNKIPSDDYTNERKREKGKWDVVSLEKEPPSNPFARKRRKIISNEDFITMRPPLNKNFSYKNDIQPNSTMDVFKNRPILDQKFINGELCDFYENPVYDLSFRPIIYKNSEYEMELKKFAQTCDFLPPEQSDFSNSLYDRLMIRTYEQNTGLKYRKRSYSENVHIEKLQEKLDLKFFKKEFEKFRNRDKNFDVDTFLQSEDKNITKNNRSLYCKNGSCPFIRVLKNCLEIYGWPSDQDKTEGLSMYLKDFELKNGQKVYHCGCKRSIKQNSENISIYFENKTREKFKIEKQKNEKLKQELSQLMGECVECHDNSKKKLGNCKNIDCFNKIRDSNVRKIDDQHNKRLKMEEYFKMVPKKINLYKKYEQLYDEKIAERTVVIHDPNYKKTIQTLETEMRREMYDIDPETFWIKEFDTNRYKVPRFSIKTEEKSKKSQYKQITHENVPQLVIRESDSETSERNSEGHYSEGYSERNSEGHSEGHYSERNSVDRETSERYAERNSEGYSERNFDRHSERNSEDHELVKPQISNIDTQKRKTADEFPLKQRDEIFLDDEIELTHSSEPYDLKKDVDEPVFTFGKSNNDGNIFNVSARQQIPDQKMTNIFTNQVSSKNNIF